MAQNKKSDSNFEQNILKNENNKKRFKSNADDILTCPVCFEMYDKKSQIIPIRVCPKEHLICKICVLQAMKEIKFDQFSKATIKCPICRSQTLLKDCQVSETILRLVDGVQKCNSKRNLNTKDSESISIIDLDSRFTKNSYRYCQIDRFQSCKDTPQIYRKPQNYLSALSKQIATQYQSHYVIFQDQIQSQKISQELIAFQITKSLLKVISEKLNKSRLLNSENYISFGLVPSSAVQMDNSAFIFSQQVLKDQDNNFVVNQQFPLRLCDSNFKCLINLAKQEISFKVGDHLIGIRPLNSPFQKKDRLQSFTQSSLFMRKSERVNLNLIQVDQS